MGKPSYTVGLELDLEIEVSIDVGRTSTGPEDAVLIVSMRQPDSLSGDQVVIRLADISISDFRFGETKEAAEMCASTVAKSLTALAERVLKP